MGLQLKQHYKKLLDESKCRAMEYEARILHSANLVHVEIGQAYKVDFMPSLLYALMKHEVLLLKEAMVKDL